MSKKNQNLTTDQALCFEARKAALRKLNDKLLALSQHVNVLYDEAQPGDWGDVANLTEALDLLGKAGHSLMQVKPKNEKEM